MSQFPEVQFIKSVAAPGQFPPDDGWEIAVAGRSNAGKSSAINAVLARKGLARTSRTPGRTQLYNYFQLAPGRRMVDLPGYGHASVHKSTRATWGPLGEALLERASFSALLLVVDSRRGVQDLDLGLLDWADLPAGQVHVLLTKCDKLARAESMAALRQAQQALVGRGSVQLFSATKGTGLEEARRMLRTLMNSGAEKINTPAD